MMDDSGSPDYRTFQCLKTNNVFGLFDECATPQQSRQDYASLFGHPSFYEQSSGISWIGVTGKDSTCLVSIKTSLRTHPLGRRQLHVKNVLATALADMSGGPSAKMSTVFRQYMITHNPGSLLHAISVAPGFADEENGHQGLPLAVSFLKERLKSDPSSTTAEIAVYALQLLLGTKYDSGNIEIQGSGCMRNYGGIEGLPARQRPILDNSYGPENGQKAFIGKGCVRKWIEKSSGISWIGVAGKFLTRVVSMGNGLRLRSHPLGRRQLRVKDVLASSLASMMLDYADGEFSRPFAIVSVAPDFVEEENGQQGPSLAVRFLEERFEARPCVSSNETIQIAVFALKILLATKFKPDKIG